MIPLLLAGLALGQERFSLDPVYVARFDAAPAEAVEAEATRRAVEAALASRHLVIPREDVPPYADYDAETYQASCPSGQRLGCAWVVGERAAAEWVLTARLEGAVLRLDVVEVSEAAAVLGVDLPVDEALAERAVVLLDLVVSAAAAADPEAGASLVADALAELEAETGALRPRTRVPLEAPRLTAADLDEWDERDDAPPWSALDMGEGEYLRFANSGLPLDQWRARSRGRAGRLSMALGTGAAWGPLATHLDARWALDDSLEVVGAESISEVRDGAGPLTSLALGLGLLPTLEVEVGAGWRRGTFAWRLHDEVLSAAWEPIPPSASRGASWWQLAARARVMPWPVARLRPTGALGLVVLWTPLPRAQVGPWTAVEPLPRQRLVAVEARPGLETDLSPHLQLFAEAGLALLLAGGEPATWSRDPEVLSERAEVEGHGSVAVEGMVGVRVLAPALLQRAGIPEEEEP